ncbi:MAG: hypothetical protein PHW40_01825 [Candidatus Izemoplasmatales bacterium]|nr:hypothetical protein [Candidatus Izemoplasmatales bacterium]MDD5293034.1 hypothetical protein [Candidatus Izemoplasmatales bacterium]
MKSRRGQAGNTILFVIMFFVFTSLLSFSIFTLFVNSYSNRSNEIDRAEYQLIMENTMFDILNSWDDINIPSYSDYDFYEADWLLKIEASGADFILHLRSANGLQVDVLKTKVAIDECCYTILQWGFS